MKKSWIKTRILTIAALLLFSVVAPFGNAGTVSAAGFSGEGDGTESDPYVIMTPTQLDEVRNDLHAYYVLGADIDLSGYASWDPIGAFKEPFTGTFDGDGHTISNLKVYHKIGPNVFFASRVGL